MTDIDKDIVAAFKKKSLNLIEASQVDTNNIPPYITYKLTNDIQDNNAYGKTVKYSTVSYDLEIWETDKKALKNKIKITDKTMSELGFIRTNVVNQEYLNLYRTQRTYEIYLKERND